MVAHFFVCFKRNNAVNVVVVVISPKKRVQIVAIDRCTWVPNNKTIDVLEVQVVIVDASDDDGSGGEGEKIVAQELLHLMIMFLTRMTMLHSAAVISIAHTNSNIRVDVWA